MAERKNRRMGPGPGPGMMPGEKAKDFKKAVKTFIAI